MDQREMIYGVCDKTGKCDSYFGFFKNEKDAEHEVEIQSNRLKEDLGMMDIEIKNTLTDDPSYLIKTEVDTNNKGPKSTLSQIQNETCSS
jgi:hypothetical protein